MGIHGVRSVFFRKLIELVRLLDRLHVICHFLMLSESKQVLILIQNIQRSVRMIQFCIGCHVTLNTEGLSTTVLQYK